MANTHLDLKDTADVTFFNLETGEKIGNLQTINFEANVICDDDFNNDSSERLMFYHEPVTISLDNAYVHGENLAYMLGFEDKPEIKRLVRLHNKTSKKRIKKKLNKRILKEISKNLF